MAAKLRITPGDINSFIGLVVDNLSVLAFLAGALIGIFHFPAEVIFGKMFPGTALGALLGNLVYTRMALRSGRSDACAMPLGIDAPTTIGMALLVLGPAFVTFKQQGMDEAAAANATWQLGMAAMVVMGMLKTILSFFGDWVLRHVPRAGLLGSIAGIALVLMGFFPLVDILRVPIVGLTCFGIVLYALVAEARMPLRIPGVLFSILVGVVLYYGLGPFDLLGPGFHAPSAPQWRFNLPWPTLGFIDGMKYTLPYLALILPFGLLMVVGGINVTESARAAGDDYKVRDILLTEALATLVAGLCGGVAQTTPYIGQPAYRAMGGRTGYTILTGTVPRLRRRVRLSVEPRRIDSARSARADPRLHRDPHHDAGVRGDTAEVLRRRRRRVLSGCREHAGDQARHAVDRPAAALRRAVRPVGSRIAGTRCDRDPRQRFHHHFDDLGEFRRRADRSSSAPRGGDRRARRRCSPCSASSIRSIPAAASICRGVLLRRRAGSCGNLRRRISCWPRHCSCCPCVRLAAARDAAL